MSDIVDWLRQCSGGKGTSKFTEAADEIERLRSDKKLLEAGVRKMANMNLTSHEMKMIRAALDKAEGKR